MPRPRGADAAGLLLRELELHPPSEEWHRRNLFGGPGTDPEDAVPSDDTFFTQGHSLDVYDRVQSLWPRKRRMSERDAAFGLNTSVGLGAYLGIMGSRRDVVTATWKTGLEGVWYKVDSDTFPSLHIFLIIAIRKSSVCNLTVFFITVHKMLKADICICFTRCF